MKKPIPKARAILAKKGPRNSQIPLAEKSSLTQKKKINTQEKRRAKEDRLIIGFSRNCFGIVTNGAKNCLRRQSGISCTYRGATITLGESTYPWANNCLSAIVFKPSRKR